VKLHYDSEGDGPLVVLLHGFPESRLSWKRQLPALARAGFRAVAPDLRGYGDSPSPYELDAYRIPAVAEDVAELIESLGGAPCVLVGHDWGAATAWTLAMMRPELIRKLVILNVPHPSAIAREVRRSFRQKVNLGYQVFFQLPLLPELFMRICGRRLLRRAGKFTPDEIDAYARQWRGHLTPMLNYYRALRRARKGGIRKQFQPVTTPTLIIWGEGEPVFLASGLDDIGEWVKDVRIERITNAGHFVQCDQPERVSELLIEFARG
jgi:pimeloyl-ACP methyl ester carboxylesterase